LPKARNANREALPARRAPSTHIRRHAAFVTPDAAPAPTILLAIVGLNIYRTNTICVVPGQRRFPGLGRRGARPESYREARLRGVPRQSLIMLWIAERLTDTA